MHVTTKTSDGMSETLAAELRETKCKPRQGRKNSGLLRGFLSPLPGLDPLHRFPTARAVGYHLSHLRCCEMARPTQKHFS